VQWLVWGGCVLAAGCAIHGLVLGTESSWQLEPDGYACLVKQLVRRACDAAFGNAAWSYLRACVAVGSIHISRPDMEHIGFPRGWPQQLWPWRHFQHHTLCRFYSGLASLGFFVPIEPGPMESTLSQLDFFDRMFESRLALVWGERSYSVYLIHYPLIFILMFLLTFAAMPRWCLLVATSISAFALTGMFWLVTYEFIERPGIRLGHFWANRIVGRRAVET
jgi:hypothetical protein